MDSEESPLELGPCEHATQAQSVRHQIGALSVTCQSTPQLAGVLQKVGNFFQKLGNGMQSR